MNPILAPSHSRFARFAIVGLSGVVVDMTLMHFLAAVQGWDVVPAKIAAGEVALLNNFLWNDRWTFPAQANRLPSPWVRLARFHVVCLGGFMAGTALTWALSRHAGLPVAAANGAAIVLCCACNYMGASRWGWTTTPACRLAPRHGAHPDPVANAPFQPQAHGDIRLNPQPMSRQCKSMNANDPCSQPCANPARGPGTSHGEIHPAQPCRFPIAHSKFHGVAHVQRPWNTVSLSLLVPPPSSEERTALGWQHQCPSQSVRIRNQSKTIHNPTHPSTS